MIGDIAAGSSTTVNFIVKIDKNAPAGEYDLLADISYQYLNYAEQFGTDSIRYYYKTVELDQELPITIKTMVVLEVSNVTTDSLNVGTEGYITMNVKNVGSESGKNAVIKLETVDGSPVIPTDASVYESVFEPGEEKTVVFKASVSDDGEAKNYPVQVVVEYTDYEGETVSSDAVTVGVDVGGKVDFEVVSEPSVLSPGEKGKITIQYENSGVTTVYNAQARISAVDPFTSNDDTAYLGDIAPGEVVTAIYEVTVDDEATLKTYAIDTEIRYRDALDNSQISDSMKAQVVIEKRSGMDILTNPIVLTLVVFIIVGIGYFVWSRKKKNNE
ncbi:COG1361 S-layer family protein [Methanolacinia petrolearia]|uniref:COG1361 S-layer family protein n=1 Tax=Methanolacinia petrolearia TaxID=54120 RepID=UPI003BAAFB78